MTHTRILILVAMASALGFLSLGASAQAVEVANPSFEQGDSAPEAWSLSGGQGDWTADAGHGRRAIAVTGSTAPGDNNYWRSQGLALEPFTVYRLRFLARRIEGKGGCPTSGPVFCNRDLTEMTDAWQAYTSVFVTPSAISPDEMWLRFGQWEVNGTVAYDALELVQAQPVYRTRNGLTLGQGESVEGTEYTFKAPFKSRSFNHSRPLAGHRCFFNSHRWVFGAGSEVTYCHRVGGLNHTSAQVEVAIGHYTGGHLLIEAGLDGSTWQEVGTIEGVNTTAFDVPADLLPALAVWIRLRPQTEQKLGQDSDPGSFQIYAYTYRAALERAPGDLRGSTQFVATPESDPRLEVTIHSFGDALPGGDNALLAGVKNTTQTTVYARPTLTLTPSGGEPIESAAEIALKPGVQELRVPYEVPGTGDVDVAFTLGSNIDYRAETSFTVSQLYDSSYGELLHASSDAVALWWASSGWKISRTRALPQQAGNALAIKAAKNEAEAAQLVVRPVAPLRGFTVAATPLTGPGGAAIPARNLELLRVHYVPVAQPTDKVGVAAPWPDPLPPLTGPIDLEAGKHQPVWVRVKVPRDAPAGLYRGAIRLAAEGYAAEVPLEVTVFDFALPDRMTCTTAFGFSAARVFRYHKLTDPGQQRLVYNKYLDTLSAHHISPYNPAALDGIGVSWPKLAKWKGGMRDTVEKHGGEGALILADDSANKSASADYDGLVDIPEQGVTLGFWYKTKDAGHPFIVTLLHHDKNDQWIYGKNNDIHIQGHATWQYFERTITSFPEGARKFRLRLWAALFAEDDSTTGTVWYDDLILTDAGTGAVLAEGDFEPLGPHELDALKPTFDWGAWDAAMTHAIDELHFNSFRFGIPGMGGGTFHARYEPSLLGYSEDTPEYKAAFTNYCQAVQAHLRQKGWLDEAFVYWFDEPDPKDYQFVLNGFRKLEQAAPEIGRMLTEQVEPELVGGPNIWCPLTPAFDPDVARERRAQGDRFWWYICTGPKAPYVTLFIDHPATELRVWLWQTWKRRIKGLLIWETNYWTSDAAYPDHNHPQNPYQDPMGWRTGYSTPPGTKMPWGNGDGRFIYPPEAAADGRPDGPVLEGPVDSIRFEMLRDGIEDHEYLVLLDGLLHKHGQNLADADRARYQELLEVPPEISTDLTHFSTDPAPIEARRQAVARAIEHLAKR